MSRTARLTSGLWALCLSVAVASSATAQVTPDYLYHGVNRPISMTVNIPEGMQGEAELLMLLPPQPNQDDPRMEILNAAPVTEGLVDLAVLFPGLERKFMPSRVRYLQLMVGGEAVGPGVVLQEMTTPARITLNDSEQIRFGKSRQVYSGLRTYVNKNVLMETEFGDIEFRLRPESAPNTAWNFRQLVEGGYYRDQVFHRVVPRGPTDRPFVAQFGCPSGHGRGGPGYYIDMEISTLPHDFGVLSMARFPSDPNSNGSQVFACLSREECKVLDGRYTAFASIVRGEDVLLAIEQTDVQGEKPVNPPKIHRVTMIDAPPATNHAPTPVRPGTKVQR